MEVMEQTSRQYITTITTTLAILHISIQNLNALLSWNSACDSLDDFHSLYYQATTMKLSL